MIVSKENLSVFNLENFIRENRKEFSIDAAELALDTRPYRLLAYLAANMDTSTIVEIGTHHGAYALALSGNPNTKIYSFDVRRHTRLKDLANTFFELSDLWDAEPREYWMDTLLKSGMIVINACFQHSGSKEYEFIRWLKEKEYPGLILCTGFWIHKAMRDNFWYKIPHAEKLDITNLGDLRGTGVISFSPRPDIVWETAMGNTTIGSAPLESPWTIVTALFDLKRRTAGGRSTEYYLNSAHSTLSLNQPMIVYCEPDQMDTLRSIRPEYLHEKTQFVPVDFEELPLYYHKEQITENRIRNPSTESRDATFYLMTMARYALLKRSIEENPFHSTHFAWLNISMEHLGYMNLMNLEVIFHRAPRDLVSTMCMKYISKADVLNTEEYFKTTQRPFSTKIITGAAANIYEMSNHMEAMFLHYMNLGYGNTDEQLLAAVYYAYPEKFDVYYGGRNQSILNYGGSNADYMYGMQNVMVPSTEAKDWLACYHICSWMYTNPALFSKGDLKMILIHYVRAAFELGGTNCKGLQKNGALNAFYSST